MPTKSTKTTKKSTTDKPRAIADGVPVWCTCTTLVDTAELVPNPANPNTHDSRQIDLLARIIQTRGWRNPITVSTRSGYIVAGHGRLQAADHAGLKVVPVDYQDFANEADEHAHLVADNRLAELATIDPGSLKVLLDGFEPIDVEMVGYTQNELDALFAGLDVNFGPGDGSESPRLDQKTPVTCPGCGEEFIP